MLNEFFDSRKKTYVSWHACGSHPEMDASPHLGHKYVYIGHRYTYLSREDRSLLSLK